MVPAALPQLQPVVVEAEAVVVEVVAVVEAVVVAEAVVAEESRQMHTADQPSRCGRHSQLHTTSCRQSS